MPLLLLMALTASLQGADRVPGAAADSVIAFVGVTVVPMDDERVLRDHTVLVVGGRITAVGPREATEVPEGATRIDGEGRYLLPGLAEMHAHVPRVDRDPAFTETVLFLYVSAGVTTVRGMLGHASHLPLRERVERGEIVGPRIWTSGPSVNGRSVQTAEAAEAAAREQKAAGFDFIKIHPGLEREVFDALDRTADEVEIGFAGHVPVAVGVDRALAAGYASIDHLDGYIHYLVRDGAPVDLSDAGGFFGLAFAEHVDETKIPRAAAATRDAGVWNVPTQILMESLLSEEPPERMAAWPEMRYMPPAIVEQWVRTKTDFLAGSGTTPEQRRHFVAVRRRVIKALQDAGAGLLLGSDAPQWWNVPGHSALRELEVLVDAGLTPYQALRTGTRNVAEFFGVLESAGTVAVGKRADLLMVDADPLADIRNLRRRAGVMVHGRWLSGTEIDERLEAIAASYAEPEPGTPEPSRPGR